MVALLGAFLIPVFISSLRGLTHVLTCRERVEARFAFQIVPGAEPVLLGSDVLTKGESGSLCGGLRVAVHARTVPDGRVAVEVPITNRSPYPWHGTVLLRLGETSIPVDVGSIDAGRTESDTLLLDLGPGLHEVSGSLLIGP